MHAGTVVALLLGTAGAAGAQLLPRFDFELSHPGARSLGFAGAFAALADDATAAYANPAGLVQLTRTEVSLEGRHWSRTPFILTGLGLDELVLGRDDSGETAPSFASVVYPHRRRWTMALYSHRVASFELDSQSVGVFPFDRRDRLDLRLDSLGAAAGVRLHERLSLGLALVLSESELRGQGEVFFQRPPGSPPAPPGPFFATSDLVIEGEDLTLSAGVLWSASDRFSAGAFYRQGARVDGRVDFTVRPTPTSEPLPGTAAASFAAPDVLGAGGALRVAGGRVTLALEVDHVGYEGLVRIETGSGEEGLARDYQNSWEYRLGGEYAFLSRSPVVAVRGGAWVESPSNDFTREDITHFALGVGIAGQHLQLDLAADFSPVIDTAALSVIYSF